MLVERGDDFGVGPIEVRVEVVGHWVGSLKF
jgi:hypothetical protein